VSKNFKNHVIKTLSSRTWRHYYSQTSKRKVPTHSPPKENCHDCVLDVLNQELQKKTNEEKKKLFSKSEFFCKLPDWKRWAIFHYTKAKRTLISVKSQPLEKRKKLICYSRIVLPSQSKTGLQFLPNSETTEQNLVCLSVATTLVFIRFVHLARKKIIIKIWNHNSTPSKKKDDKTISL